jgi:hypothetical protein
MANPKFTKVRAVTLSVLKLAKGQPRYFYFQSAMYKGKQIDDKKEAATLIHAIDLETGEDGVIIAPMVMQKELNEAYPGEAYRGRCFEVVITRDPEKKYNHVGISEVSQPEDFTPPAPLAADVPPAAKGKGK